MSLGDKMINMNHHINLKHEGQISIKTECVKVGPRMALELNRPEIGEEMDNGHWVQFLQREKEGLGGDSFSSSSHRVQGKQGDGTGHHSTRNLPRTPSSAGTSATRNKK